MGEFEFQRRWEFRRNDDNDPDSSFNDSISSDGSLIRKQKLVSRLISLGDDETSEVSRLKQMDNENPGKACQINAGNVTKRKTGNKISSKMKKDSPEDVDLQKGETSALELDHGPLDELKIFMESLLKDLRVTRESLLKWMIDEMQHLVNNTQEKNRQQVPIRDEENNSFGYGMDRSLVRFPTGAIVPGSTDYLNALGDQNVQVQSNTSVVLATEAQKTQGGSLKRNTKGKKTVDLGDHHQVPEDQAGHGQAIRAAGACTNVSSPFGQAPWSMYPMLPTFLTGQIPANQGPNASLYNYVLPRPAETKSCMNPERVNQMLEPGSNQGSFPIIPPEETIRRFALTGPRNTDCINQKSTPSSSGIGTGLHQGIDFGLSISNPRQNNPQNLPQETSKPLGLKMNGGAAKFCGGSYNLSANNHHSNPTYKSDGRLLSYQMQNLKDGHLFLQ